jgi:hypothetical protein
MDALRPLAKANRDVVSQGSEGECRAVEPEGKPSSNE